MSSHPAGRWTPLLEIGLAVITVGAFVAARGGNLDQDSAVGALVLVPSIMWAMSARIVEAPSSNVVTIYRAANTLALVALAVPVVAGEVHWGIVVLPFALFRIAMNAASHLAGARAVTRRIQWFGGAWVAGWAGVLP